MIDETAAEIAAMRTHSSSEVAIKAARSLRALVDREYVSVAEFERDLEHNIGALRRANPSHASLETALREINQQVLENDHNSLSAAREGLASAIDTVVDRIQSAKDQAASNAAALLSDGDTILTHDYSSTVLAAIETAVADGKELTVYVTEARPRFLGRKTARSLASIEGVEPILIVDSAAATYLPECDRVLTGMTCIVGDTLYNRVGTYPIAAVTAREGIPFTVTGSSTKVLDSGFVFDNDFREASEVLREPADGFTVANPAYDATPTELIEQLVTEHGINSP